MNNAFKLKTVAGYTLLVMGGGMVLTACTSQLSESPHYGVALRHNQERQAYNPGAATGPEKSLYLHGQKASKVIDNYHKESKEIDSGKLVEDIAN